MLLCSSGGRCAALGGCRPPEARLSGLRGLAPFGSKRPRLGSSPNPPWTSRVFIRAMLASEGRAEILRSVGALLRVTRCRPPTRFSCSGSHGSYPRAGRRYISGGRHRFQAIHQAPLPYFGRMAVDFAIWRQISDALGLHGTKVNAALKVSDTFNQLRCIAESRRPFDAAAT